MSSMLSQISYPVFLFCVFAFFLIVSLFSLIVGVSFAVRSVAMLRLFEILNRSYSIDRLVEPLTRPHFVEPVLLKHRGSLGTSITLGAALSIALLADLDAIALQPVFLDPFSYFSALMLAGYTKSFLLVGNGLCVAVGLLILFFPRQLSRIEAFTDKWYTLQKQTLPLEQMHLGVDQWALAHPTVFGITLSLMSSGLFASMYAYI